MTSPSTNTLADVRIDQVLNALGTTQAPSGLEQRIAARLAQAAEAPTGSPTPHRAPSAFFAVILDVVKAPLILFTPARRHTLAAALILLITVTALVTLHRRTPIATSQITAAVSTPAHSPDLPGNTAAGNANVLPPTTLPASRSFNLGTRRHIQRVAFAAPAQPDPDAIALAETLAPTRAAPPMPATRQEQLLAAAMRPGQPLQLAALEQASAPALRAQAQAREDARIQRYVHSMLAPFAVADELSPNNTAEPREISVSTPAPHTPVSLNN
jgi:hypothetical protein